MVIPLPSLGAASTVQKVNYELVGHTLSQPLPLPRVEQQPSASTNEGTKGGSTSDWSKLFYSTDRCDRGRALLALRLVMRGRISESNVLLIR